MTDIGKQVRELLPEYPHLWSRVIAMVERLEQENVVLREALELLGDHHKDCGCWCMDHRGIAREALDKARALREGK